MLIFISWSGEHSHRVAIALREWLPIALPYAKPWVSSADIAKGQRWSTEISKALRGANFGVICLDSTNANEPWLTYEAGALSNVVDASRVSPFLLDITPSDVHGPLSQFQCTEISEPELQKLARSINQASITPFAADKLERIVRATWAGLRDELAEISKQVKTKKSPKPEAIPAEEVLDNSDDDLEDFHIEILKLYISAPGSTLPAMEIASRIKVSAIRAEHYANWMVDHGYLRYMLLMNRGKMYTLGDRGRAYLVNNNLA